MTEPIGKILKELKLHYKKQRKKLIIVCTKRD